MVNRVAESTTIGRVFNVKSLARPTITPALREKVLGAYNYIRRDYSFLARDIRMGAKRSDLPVLDRLNYEEYEISYNSVLLGTMLNALINGNMIYFGPPGSGKTTTPEIVGQVLFGLSLKEIQQATIYGHTNLTEEKMTASFNIPKLMKGIKEVVWSTWVEQFYRMLDEANRVPPETTSILMQAIDRRRVSYAGETAEMPWGPIYATANYYDAGNFEMTPPFLDRFGISVKTKGLSGLHIDLLWKERPEMDRTTYALSQEDRETILSEIHSINIKQETLAFLAHLINGLSSCELAGIHPFEKDKSNFKGVPIECSPEKCGFKAEQMICSQIREEGVSTRNSIALRDYSRAFAWFLGKEEIDNEIMKIVFAMVNSHRLSPSKIAMNGGESSDGILVDKKRFLYCKEDFAYHIWEMANNAFIAQNPIYTEIDAFYLALLDKSKSKEVLLIATRELFEKVNAMEDPAKWELSKGLQEAREIIFSRV